MFLYNFLFWFEIPSLISFSLGASSFVCFAPSAPSYTLGAMKQIVAFLECLMEQQGVLLDSRDKPSHALGFLLGTFIIWEWRKCICWGPCPQLWRDQGNQLLMQDNIHSSEAHESGKAASCWHHEATVFFPIFTIFTVGLAHAELSRGSRGGGAGISALSLSF